MKYEVNAGNREKTVLSRQVRSHACLERFTLHPGIHGRSKAPTVAKLCNTISQLSASVFTIFELQRMRGPTVRPTVFY